MYTLISYQGCVKVSAAVHNNSLLMSYYTKIFSLPHSENLSAAGSWCLSNCWQLFKALPPSIKRLQALQICIFGIYALHYWAMIVLINFCFFIYAWTAGNSNCWDAITCSYRPAFQLLQFKSLIISVFLRITFSITLMYVKIFKMNISQCQ